MVAGRLQAYTATSTAGKDMKLLRSINSMSPAKKVIGTGLGLGTLGLAYKAHKAMEEEAKKEFDPIETTLDGVEKYVLDPLGSLSLNQAAALAALTGAGYSAYKYFPRKEEKSTEKKAK